jgi:nitrite reductase (NO-forming)
MVAQHITNGMYGMILVEPEGGLSKVDREFYVMQGELYTNHKHGAQGLQEFSLEKLLAENPEHMMFNGNMDALTKTFKMEANVGETVRIFFGVGGPNLASSFHVIGEVFDKVYDHASFTSTPLTDVQTTMVPPGGATVVEFKVDYPGEYILVDHALSRMEKGLAGILTVKGKADHTIFHAAD